MADRRARFVEEIAAPREGAAYDGVGADLRHARERLGLDLADVAVALRIQFAHLDAVERGRFQELPGPAYAIGFIRSYARYLLLDGEAAVAQFKAETSISPRRGRLVAPEPLGEARRPRGLLILASLALVGAVYGGWVWLQERERLAVEAVPSPPQSGLVQPQSSPAASISPAAPSGPATTTGALAPAAPAPAVAPIPATPAPATPAAATPAPVTQAPPAQGAQPESGAAGESQATQEASEDEESTPPPSPNTSEPPTLTPAAAVPTGAPTAQMFGLENQDARVVLRARADSWVRIRGANNELVLERTLRTGDTYLVPNRPDLMLWTGNAGGLEVIVDGAPTAPLGPSGAARRDIQLDPDRLRRGG